MAGTNLLDLEAMNETVPPCIVRKGDLPVYNQIFLEYSQMIKLNSKTYAHDISDQIHRFQKWEIA